MSKDSSTNKIDPLDEVEPSKPEEFYFAVEVWDDIPITTICPTAIFDAEKHQIDQYYDDISQLLMREGFENVMECSYEHDDEKLTAENIRERMLKLGFKQSPGYDSYIKATSALDEFDDFMLAESEGDLVVSDEDEEEDTDSGSLER